MVNFVPAFFALLGFIAGYFLATGPVIFLFAVSLIGVIVSFIQSSGRGLEGLLYVFRGLCLIVFSVSLIVTAFLVGTFSINLDISWLLRQ